MPSFSRRIRKAANSVPGSKVMLCRREGGKILNCLSMPAMTPAEWRARITSQDRKSAAPFDQRCQVRFAKFLSRSEEHTSELQSLMRISYAVFCLKTKTTQYYTKLQA